MQTIRRIAITAVISTVVMFGAIGTAAAEERATEEQAPEEIVISWRVAQDSGTNFRVIADIRNQTSRSFNDWSFSAPFRHRVSEITGAISIQDDSSIAISSTTPLPSGAEHTVEFSAVSVGPVSRTPATCSFEDVPCRVVLPGDSVVDPEPLGVQPQHDSPGSGDPAEQDGPSGSLPDAPGPEVGPVAGDQDETEPTEPSASQPAIPASGRALTLRVSVVRDWGGGQSVRVVVRNDGPEAIERWSASFPWDVAVDSMWNAESTSGGGFVRFSNADWNGQLEPGQAVEVGFTGSPGAMPAPEGDCSGTTDLGSAQCRIAPVDRTVPPVPEP